MSIGGDSEIMDGKKERETVLAGRFFCLDGGGGTILEQSCGDDAKTQKVYKKNKYGLECCAEP